ncbi:MAG: META domain-containing protein [Tabrizicola sp.]|nr:META domain-containing protein [Tabrizicola sp.]
MRRLALALLVATALTGPVSAKDPTGIDWQLLAIDGKVVDIPATLRIEASGSLSGHAPCNSFGARNLARYPELDLQGIRSTKRACDRLDQEQAFFSALKSMTRAEQTGERNLVLLGPDGRSMEFVVDLMNSLTVCTTCPKAD